MENLFSASAVLGLLQWMAHVRAGEWIAYLLLVTTLQALVHELGHVTAAHLCGVPSRELSIGMGPRFFSFIFPGTQCRLSFRVFPIGGRASYRARIRILRPLKRAFVCAGGWLAELALTLLLLAALRLHLLSAPLLVFPGLLLVTDVLLGLTPLTSDGQKFLYHLGLALKKQFS